MPISEGINVLQVESHRVREEGIYRLHIFNVHNPINEKYCFGFKVPVGMRAHELVDFLHLMKRTGRWFQVSLSAKRTAMGSILAITKLSDPRPPQEEIQGIFDAAVGKGKLDSRLIKIPERLVVH